MPPSTSYGTWANHGNGGLTIEDNLADALGDFGGDFDIEAIARDYRAAINANLTEGIILAGNEFIGPHPIVEEADVIMANAVENVDFWSIAARYDSTDVHYLA